MRTVTCINVFLWGALVWLGRSLSANVAARNIQGYPNHGQLVYYVYVPMGMVVLALAAFALARIRKVKYLALVIEILVLLALLPFMLPYTGGV
jgi:hypothetical protein